jgi:hypothetical protein
MAKNSKLTHTEISRLVKTLKRQLQNNTEGRKRALR